MAAALIPLRFNNSFQGKQQYYMSMSPKSNYYLFLLLLPCKSRPRTTRTSLSCQSHELLPADPPPSRPSQIPGEEMIKRHVDHQKRADKDHETIKEEEKKKKKKKKMYGEAGKLKRGLKESLRPRHDKGDWKDLFLMSFSFAVYVYISQKIVCAYCAWMAML